jgi:hypothetical protein
MNRPLLLLENVKNHDPVIHVVAVMQALRGAIAEQKRNKNKAHNGFRVAEVRTTEVGCSVEDWLPREVGTRALKPEKATLSSFLYRIFYTFICK